MHQKLTKHEKFCKQINQLPTKSHVELKDNSIMHQISSLYLALVDQKSGSTVSGTISMATTHVNFILRTTSLHLECQ
jgi:hypothetical protein